VASLIALPSTCSLALIEGSYVLNLCACPLNFSRFESEALGFVDALFEIIEQRKVILSQWCYSSACSSAIAVWIRSIFKRVIVNFIVSDIKRGIHIVEVET
jgi:hypothetical protein